jgi:predicted MFS family arabinose efflux permease
MRLGGDQPTSQRVLLWTLLVIYILNFLDRQIVNILAEPISRDLGLSDFQIGLMTGLAFALFYTLLGIPIARYADRPKSNRVGLIAIALAIWSGMTAISGLAQNFTQLLLARIGVGVGEAGCTPAAMSLITDSVPKEKRASAIGFYGLGVPIGSLLGALIGGLIADAYGWRAAFMTVGIPGVLLACFLPFILRDARRDVEASPSKEAPAMLSVPEAFREILSSRAFVLIMIAASLTAFLGYGKTTWAGIYFMRSLGMSPGEVGVWLAIPVGIAGIIGTWAGGALADRFGAKDRKYILYAPAIGMALGAPLLFLGYWVDDWRAAIALLVIPTACNLLYYGPTYACVQGLVRPEARATASALMLFAQNLIGLGLGPTFFGALSDALKPIAGGASVQWVLWIASWMALIPALIYWRAAPYLQTELKSA